MVKTQHKRLKTVCFNKIIDRPSGIFATGEGNNTVILTLALIFGDDFVKLDLLRLPVYVCLEFVLATDIADAFIIESDSFVSLREKASGTMF
jgi:hypothetical protein